MEIQGFALTPGAELVRVSALAVLLGGALYLVLALVFVRVYLSPLTGLVHTAGRMAEGQEAYPDEVRAPAEAQRLSAALARLEATRN